MATQQTPLLQRLPVAPPSGLSQTAILVTAAVAVPLAFHPWSPEPFEVYKTWLLALAALGTALIGLSTNWLARATWSRWPEGALAVGLVAWAALSSRWATNPCLSWQEMPHLAAPVAMCIAARASLTTPARRIALCGSGALAGLCISLVVLGELIGRPFFFGQTGRILAMFGHPNTVAQALVCTIGFTVGLFMAVARFRARALLAVLLSLQLIAMVATISRGAWVGLAAGWILAGSLAWWRFAQRRNLRKLLFRLLPFAAIVAGALILVAVWGQSSPALGERTMQDRLWRFFSRGASGRGPIWKSTCALIGDHPWRGVGYGNYATEYPAYCSNNEEYVLFAHNDVLQIASELGVPATAVFVLLHFLAVRRGLAVINRSRSPLEWGLCSAFLAVVVGTFVNALFSYNYYQPASAMYLYISIGAIGSFSKPEDERCHRPIARSVGFLLALGLAAIGGRHLLQQWQSKKLYDEFQASRVRGDVQEAAAALAKAKAVAPGDPRFHFFEGLLRNERRDFDGATASLLRARALSPHVWQVHYFLGMSLLAQNRLPESEKALQRARELRKGEGELDAAWNLIQQRKSQSSVKPAND